MSKASLDNSLDVSPILKADFFSTLLKGEYGLVLSRSSLFQLRKNALLFSPGQKAEHFFMLLEGVIRVYKPRDDDGEDEMARFTPGDTIGDFDFARSAEYDAFAEAAEDSVLIMFPGFGLTMEQFALESPHAISKILLNSIVMMTGRIKSTHKIIVENMSWVQELHRRAYEDPATGLWKQTFLTDEINRILEDPMALIMLKPDRFKILVDSRGHGAGDEAMVHIAMALKNITRRIGRGWPLRFKSNETGILINKCTPSQAETYAGELLKLINAIPPVPAQNDIPAFSFSGTMAWGVWPSDDIGWESLFQGTYSLLLDAWRAGGNRVEHYHKTAGRQNPQGNPKEERS
ncbi:MAG: cyclic nucleotide-binding domain-containing protein [Treponema sp.]|jgi:diguanylate cyclase (GGDEF)-like protein|nr:cyclic nucleotide-binding domain-containing protein [Treponema sp.]